jgi:hypothetical protein
LLKNALQKENAARGRERAKETLDKLYLEVLSSLALLVQKIKNAISG